MKRDGSLLRDILVALVVLLMVAFVLGCGTGYVLHWMLN